ncbi:Uncharacterized protein GBIM_01700 [Gryllus bimaculatus]|nr:Uncharacterized protein GBIM_01700 [Gryllus bimaculatus]
MVARLTPDQKSSEGEDDAPGGHGHGDGAGGGGGGPDYENVAWHGEDRRLQALPFRSRAGVYSPSPPSQDAPPDLHNDSGYSTRLYGSSKGPSPALSGGHIECDSMLPPSATAHALYGTGPGPVITPAQRGTPRGRYDEDPPSGATVVTASLV